MTLRDFLILSRLMVVNKKIYIFGSDIDKPICFVDCVDKVVQNIDVYVSDSILNMNIRHVSIGVDIDIFVE